MRHRLASTPPRPDHIPRDPRRVGLLVAVARNEIGMLQRSLASKLRVSERTMQRLESGESPPGGHQRVQLAELLSDASDETWNALIEALELPVEPSPTPEPPPTKAAEASASGPSRPFDDLVHELADDLDVPAGRLRVAFDTLLAEIDARGLSASQARPLVATRSGAKRKGRRP
jgi:transcriptional regulator with XRE-family HTH domain